MISLNTATRLSYANRIAILTSNLPSQSLCRDLEKEGMKEWLDMMLEKVAIRVSDEGGPSSRDKELRMAEKKKLQALIERHDKLMPPTIETQEKVSFVLGMVVFSLQKY